VNSADGVGTLTIVSHAQPDLILLDIDLPGIDGITLCGTIRTQVTTPIILLTNGADELQQVIGLDRGADLCLVKPVSLAELRAHPCAAAAGRAQRDAACPIDRRRQSAP